MTERISRRERADLTFAALLAPLVALVPQLPAALAGRGGWLAPLLALPAALGVLWLWRRMGPLADLPAPVRGAYLLWGGFLLTVSAGSFARRSLAVGLENGTGPLFLLVMLVLVLVLSRGRLAVFARAGKLFFLLLCAALAGTLLLALPDLRWENLLPVWTAELSGVPAGGLAALSLTVYAVYALCLPIKEGDPIRPGRWAAVFALAAALLTFTALGAFGPALIGEMHTPFFFLLKGVGIPGALQRGEAVVMALWMLSDLVLLALLTRSCASLWEGLRPRMRGRAALPVAALAFLAAALLPNDRVLDLLTQRTAVAGNLVFGVLLPALAVLAGAIRGGRGRPPISCGPSAERGAHLDE